MIGRPGSADVNGQLIVSLAIVGILGALGGGLAVAAVITRDWGLAGPVIGTIVGALATALNAPTGVGNLLRASKTPPEV